MSTLMIAGIEIHQDQDGRFSLNDFHRAAGGEDRHSPNRWTRTEGYDGLVKVLTPELAFAPSQVKRGGAAPGTYACKELIYSYAMWISPEFHIKVVRTFDAAVQGVAANDSFVPVERRLPVAADSFDAAKRISESLGLVGNQATLSANRMVKETIGVDLMEMAGVKSLVNEAQELNYTPTELGARFGMGARDMNKLLEKCGLQRNFEYAKGKRRWELLPDGKVFAVIVDTAKKHSDGKPVQQILWKESVLGMLKRLADQLQAGLPRIVASGPSS